MVEVTETFKVECQNNGCEFACTDHEAREDAEVCALTHDVQCDRNSRTEHLLAAHSFMRTLREHGFQPAGG
jgi:hypothetical protein